MPTQTKVKRSYIWNLQTNYGDGFQFFKYLKDPAQPILDALDKDSSPKDDTWDSVSVVTFPENALPCGSERYSSLNMPAMSMLKENHILPALLLM